MKHPYRMLFFALAMIFGIFTVSFAQLQVPPVVSPDDSLPVRGSRMLSPDDRQATFHSAVGDNVLRDLSLDLSAATRVQAVHTGPPIDHPEPLSARFHVSSGGLDQVFTCQGTALIRESPTLSPPGIDLYQTEVLSLDLSGGTLPAGMRLRESPTLQSTGQTTVKRLDGSGGGGGGGFLVSSFFDIFTELSLDGGATWTPADQPIRLECKVLQPPPLAPHPNVVQLGTYNGGDLDGDGIPDLVILYDGAPIPVPSVGSSDDEDVPVSALLRFNGKYYVCGTTSHFRLHVTRMPDDPTSSFFDTEMLQLDLSGGSLPSGVMVRESPSKASLGRTSVRTMGDGTYRISSFFDVFTELSVDGGNTWTPQQPSTLQFTDLSPELPEIVPPVVALDDSLPVAGSSFVDPADTRSSFNAGGVVVVLDGLEIDASSSRKVHGLHRGSPFTEEVTGVARVHLTGTPALDALVLTTCNADAILQQTPRSGPPGVDTYDTEMLSMTLSGGSLPAGVMIRESPTLPSKGQTTIRVRPGDDGYRIGSFFDIFTEISLDGGATWAACDQPIRLEEKLKNLGVLSPLADVIQPGTLAIGDLDGDGYPDLVLKSSGPPIPPPAVGSSSTDVEHTVGRIHYDELEITLADVPITVRTTHTHDEGDTQFFDTEMLQMDLSGGTLPGGVMVRESPSKASLGRTSIKSMGGGSYKISSFFDVFTELSVDGGNTWIPQTPGTLVFSDTVPPPPPPVDACVSTDIFPDDQYPPVGTLQNPPGTQPIDFSDGAHAWSLIARPAGSRASLPNLGLASSSSFPVDCDMLVSPPGSSSLADVHLTGNAGWMISHTNDNGPERVFSVELLQLDLASSGGSTGSVMLRESPTLQSTGQIKVAPDGTGYRMDSFFDVFTEISFDGGATWAPASKAWPVRWEMSDPTEGIPTLNYPPVGLFKGGPDCMTLRYANGAAMQDITFFDIVPGALLPSSGGTAQHSSSCRMRAHLSLDGGSSFFDIFTDVSLSCSSVSTNTTGTERHFDTEMLSMTLTANLPGSGTVMIRESPTLPSRGQTMVRESPTLPRISSFFDIFTEMSLDGGITWSPQSNALRIALDTLQPSTISGRKWLDANGNGIPDAGENGISNWKVYLADTAGTLQDSAVTDLSGNYTFANVSTGIHRVYEQPQPGWLQSGGAPAYGFYVVPGDTFVGADFGNLRSSTLTGTKFEDHNSNGVRDPEDEGLSGWEVCIYPTKPPNPNMEVGQGTGSFSLRLNGLPPGEPVIGSLLAIFASKKGYDYYQAQSKLAFPTALKGSSGRTPRGTTSEQNRSYLYSKFENGDIPTEMQMFQVQLTGSTGGALAMGTIKIRPKGWDGTIKGTLRESPTLTPIKTAIFDEVVDFELRITKPGYDKLRCSAHMLLQADIDGDGPPRLFHEGTTYSNLGPVSLMDDQGAIIGTLDSFTMTAGGPASPDAPMCTVTDSTGHYSFDPMPPGTWVVMEHGQPCWDQTTPAPAPITVADNPVPACTSPDNGTGTADLPASCDYTGGKMSIVDGLPAGSPLESDATFKSFVSITRTPGGPLGGEEDQFGGTLQLDMQGTGDFASFHRVFSIPVSSTFDYAPRVPGNPLQSFACDLGGLQGQLPPGDPDFDLLRITAGTSYGMPSPGHTTLMASSTGWNVESFFDITYRIDFIGHPGSPLGGMSGSTTGTIRWSQGMGSNIPPVDFGNHERLGTISIAKYEDINHNQIHDPGEPAMAGVSFVLTNLATTAQVTLQTDGSGMVSFGNLAAGDYRVTEIVPAGYAVSKPKAGEDFVTVSGCDTSKLEWLNSAALTDSTFRTATYEDWATAVDLKNGRKEIKCKPDKVEFKLNLVVPQSASGINFVSGLNLKFSMPVTQLQFWSGKSKTIPFCFKSATPDAKNQAWTLDLACESPLHPPQYPAPGDTIQIDGIGLKGKPITLGYIWTSLAKPLGGKLPSKRLTPGDTIKLNQPRLPMPNLVNVLGELQAQGAFPIVVGGAVGDTHSVFLKGVSDILKSLSKPVRGSPFIIHDSTNLGGCFDIINGKPVKKQIKGLTPDKVQNRLFAEALTLKLNILASRYRKFPAGLDTLIYDYHKLIPGPFDGKHVGQILAQVDSFLSCKPNPKPLATALDYYFVMRRINGAFAGPIDTIRWSCQKLEMDGVRKLKDVPFLRAEPGALTAYKAIDNELSASYRQPAVYSLAQNYPNPFNPTTNIQFALAEPSMVTLTVYNMLGQQVAVLLNNEWMEDGTQEVEFNATSLPSGVYFYRIQAQGFADEENGTPGQKYTSVKKMLLVK